MKLPTREKGDLQVLTIRETNGVWEPEWEPLRGTPIGDLLTVVNKDVLDHALRGWSKPLVGVLGLPPSGAKRKLPVVARECVQRNNCATYVASTCQPKSRDLPWCYEPDGLEGKVKLAASKAIRFWHEGVYLIVVRA